MSCGLGAIILVFMLVKHNVDSAVPISEIDLLRNDLALLTDQKRQLRQRIADKKANSRKASEYIQASSEELARSQAKLSRKLENISEQRDRLVALKKTIEKTVVPKASDVVDDPQVGEEDYLIGLKVEGRKIGILIDSSASMTDEVLIDVIRRKNRRQSEKKAGPKWQRTKRIVRWLLARLPESSTVNVVAYSDKARPLGGVGWKSGRDANALDDVFRDLDALVPEGPTNLEAGLQAIRRKKPSSVYLITDGLPTMGDSAYRSLNPFSSCSALWGQSNKISGECRAKLFQHTLISNALPSGVPVNVILLPIEGDPEASSAYWLWTAATGGLLISPADSWP
jgi:hypothetical protein